MDANHQATDLAVGGRSLALPRPCMGGQSPHVLSAEEHVLDRAFGEPRRRSDTASDSAAVCPHAPTPAVMLGIDPSMVGATPRHHEPDASDRVNLRSLSNRPPPPGGSGFSKAQTDLPGG